MSICPARTTRCYWAARMTEYTPVDCGLHSEYELAIMQRRKLTLSWHDEQQAIHRKTITPIDLTTQAGAEYLHVRAADGLEYTIRLDRITACEFL